MTERKAMTKAKQGTHECQLLAVHRSSAYARAQPVKSAALALMRILDELYLTRPFHGSRHLCDALQQRDHCVNRKRVRHLMRQMGLRAIYPKPRTSQAGKGHRIYPYRLRGLPITNLKQVLAITISYIPMAKGFMYLTMVTDWYSRWVLT